MILFYSDDAGNTGRNLLDPSQPYHYVTALAVQEGKWAKTLDEYRILVNAKAPGNLDANGNPIGRFELHGAEVWNRKGVFKTLAIADRVALFEGVVDILVNNDLPLFYGRCDKARLHAQYSYPAHPHWLAAFLCLERVAAHCNTARELGVVIADQNAAVEQMVKDFVSEYRRKGPPFGVAVPMDKITDNVHFMASWESPHMQLCDMANWLLARAARGLTPVLLRTATLRLNPQVKASRTIPY